MNAGMGMPELLATVAVMGFALTVALLAFVVTVPMLYREARSWFVPRDLRQAHDDMPRIIHDAVKDYTEIEEALERRRHLQLITKGRATP